LLVDQVAVRAIDTMDYDFSTIAANINPITRAAWIVRSLHADAALRAFLREHPSATVVNLGCGLDTTFARVDNGTVTWYDLDLPDVIELRVFRWSAHVPGTVHLRCLAHHVDGACAFRGPAKLKENNPRSGRHSKTTVGESRSSDLRRSASF
jgi:O-methyltransferase involved in polyketide biosynthesis